MFMSKEKFAEIVNKYDLTICGSACVEDAFNFVCDILRAESDAIRESEPYATTTISRYERALETIFCDLDCDAFCDEYNEIFR